MINYIAFLYYLSVKREVFFLYYLLKIFVLGFLGDASGKEPAYQCRRLKRHVFDPLVGKIPEGAHGNPFQYSCLETPIDRGIWWVTVHRVAKSWT